MADDATTEITASAQLVGGISLIFGDSKGGLSQWFMARDPDGEQRFKHIRSFQMGTSPIIEITAEQRRKGFLALDAAGEIGVFHSTAHRTLLVEKVAEGPGVMALSPRANRVIVEEGGKLLPLTLKNPHPEVSWSALWSKVWYENYDEPKYVWQSTAANTDFEPKMSLAPLTFGTLKAAFYAMLLAAPLAVAAAIYTAYFMAPSLRRKVKPVIELMEAMPTVILGFFAGLFLAPYVEGHLPGIFSLLMLLPIGILVAGFIFSRLPESIRLRVPDGWESAILIPVILFVGWLSLHHERSIGGGGNTTGGEVDDGKTAELGGLLEELEGSLDLLGVHVELLLGHTLGLADLGGDLALAFSPKMARSSFSSGVSWVSPFGVTLPTRMSPAPTSAPT